MKVKITQLLLLILVCLPPSLVRSTSLLGVSPQDEKYYSNGGSEFIKCKDGSKKINRSQLNDDFCDCLDASDEPGTSACPNGKFYCQNAGHMPLVVFSSRVNDGICDCCDGSDEYDGKVKCTNMCWDAGKAARDKLQKKIATYKEGVIVRRKEIEQAKVAFAKDEAELSKLKGEEKILKGLVDQLRDRKEQIEKQEEKERLEKEKEEKLRKEAENESDEAKTEEEIKTDSEKEQHSESANDVVTDNTNSEQGVKEVVSDIADNDESEIEEPSSNAVEPETAEPENTEGLSKEELGRLVASRWTGEKTDEQSGGSDDVKDNDTPKEPSIDVHDEDDEDEEDYDSEFDNDDRKYDENNADHHKYDEDDAGDNKYDESYDDHVNEDHVDSSSYKSDFDDDYEDSASRFPTWLVKIQSTVKNILQGFNLFQTPLNTTDAARVRKEYDESSAKLSKIQSRISTLSEKVKLDFGPEKEFYSFYDRCFESKQNKYVYKVCPFKKATQEEGHMTTRLGRWEKFEDSYKVMLFSNGDRCWNGPDRSMKVRLRCGLKNEVTDVDEPSRCEYVALLSTPTVCVEEKLQELQQKLDALNNQQPNHDEL